MTKLASSRMAPKKDKKDDKPSKRAEGGGGGKAKKKKWSKGKVKDKANNLVALDKATQERLHKEVPTYKVITVSVLVDRLKVNGSLARRCLRELHAQGKIRLVSAHSSQMIFTRNTGVKGAEEEAEEAKAADAGGKAAKKAPVKKAAAAAPAEEEE